MEHWLDNRDDVDEVDSLAGQIEDRMAKRAQVKAEKARNTPYALEADAVWSEAGRVGLTEGESQEVYKHLAEGESDQAKEIVAQAKEAKLAESAYIRARDKWINEPSNPRLTKAYYEARARAGK